MQMWVVWRTEAKWAAGGKGGGANNIVTSDPAGCDQLISYESRFTPATLSPNENAPKCGRKPTSQRAATCPLGANQPNIPPALDNQSERRGR